jgi:hypothetical protein
LKEITGRHTNADDIRLAGIVSRIRDLVRILIACGNFWFALSALSWFSNSVRYASIGVTLKTYIETAVWIIENGLSEKDLADLNAPRSGIAIIASYEGAI